MASVLITGTSKGIGFEAALAFARAGHTVHATMRNPFRSPELVETAVREKLPILVSAMDVDSDESVSHAIAAIQRQNGAIDVLVNNAGVAWDGAVEELALARFKAIFETNYFGVLRCVQAVVPQMRQRRSGCIINVSSVGGRISCPPLTAYHSSKWALEGLTEGLAGEMKTFNVRVAMVEPGIVHTGMAEQIRGASGASAYRQGARFAALYAAALQNPVPPAVVARKIVEIAESGTRQLRHPVGPDAEPFLEWRRKMTDEQWVEFNASDDETWYRLMERDFGIDARPKP